MKKLIVLMILASMLLTFVCITTVSAAPHITATLLNQDPDPVEQGDVVEVRFKIENDGSETLENVEVEILPKYPFSLYTGEALQPIGKLRSGQTGADAIIVDYKLKVDSSAIDGDNEIELIVRSGAVEFSYTQNQFMVEVKEYHAPDIRVYIIENNILQSNTKGTITLELANVGLGDVKFLQMTLLPSEDYHLISSSDYIYLGSIDSDDTDSEDFDIFVTNVKDGIVSIPIKLEYQDTNEKPYVKNIDLQFNVYTPEELSKYGLKEKSYTLIIIIILLLAIIVYLFWKKKRN